MLTSLHHHQYVLNVAKAAVALYVWAGVFPTKKKLLSLPEQPSNIKLIRV